MSLDPIGGAVWGQPQLFLCPGTQGGGGLGPAIVGTQEAPVAPMFVEPIDSRGILRYSVGQLLGHLADDGVARPEQSDEDVLEERLVRGGTILGDAPSEAILPYAF